MASDASNRSPRLRTRVLAARFGFALVASLVALFANGQEAKDWRAERQKVLDHSVATLESLVDWCNTNEVFAERDKLFRAILRIDPNNFRAHKGLKHVQASDGSWTPPSSPIVSKNFNHEATIKFADKLRTATRATCDELFALIDTDALAGADRDLVEQDVLAFDPDNARIHTERGEAKLGDAWVLSETIAAKKHRPEIKELVRRAVADAPQPEHCDVQEDERALGVNWACAVRTPHVHVLSTGALDEASQLARYASATADLVRSLFDDKATDALHLTIYVIGSADDKRSFLAHHPAIDPAQRDALQKMSSVGLTSDGDFMTSAATAEQRLDTVVRQTLAHFFRVDLHLDPDVGWAFEGFGIYLTRELCGTRMTWYVLPDKADAVEKDLRARLMRKDCNWMNEAHELLESARRPDLAVLVTKGIDALSLEDLLYSYVLTAYLLEARGGDAPAILARIGEKHASIDKVLGETLGLEPAALDLRVRRWLSERH